MHGLQEHVKQIEAFTAVKKKRVVWCFWKICLSVDPFYYIEIWLVDVGPQCSEITEWNGQNVAWRRFSIDEFIRVHTDICEATICNFNGCPIPKIFTRPNDTRIQIALHQATSRRVFKCCLSHKIVILAHKKSVRTISHENVWDKHRPTFGRKLIRVALFA